MIIAIDFDGTCVTHDFPKVGKEIGAVSVLKQLVKEGHLLVLFTMRSDIEKPKTKDGLITRKGGKYLTAAVNWFKKHGIPLYGVNTNPTQKEWTHSPKAYAQLYIDDAALGCPLMFDEQMSDKPFVHWPSVRTQLMYKGILRKSFEQLK